MNFKSHLNTVVMAINTLVHLREVIIKQFKSKITDEIVRESEKYGEFILDLTVTKELLTGCLIVAESSEENKKQLLKIIDSFMGNDNFNKFIATYIKDKKSAEKVALSLSFIGMYADYLDGKDWEGPVLSSNRFENRFKVRSLLGVESEDFVNAYIKLNNSKEVVKSRKLLEELDTSDLINDVIGAYIIMNRQKEKIIELESYIDQLKGDNDE